jgi:hypothetical protein
LIEVKNKVEFQKIRDQNRNVLLVAEFAKRTT